GRPGSATSEHDCSPSAAAGFKTTPAGNATVVSLTFASTNPSGSRLTACGTCSVTLNPVGVLPASPSGVTLNDGLNGSRLQPSSAGNGWLANDSNDPLASHE